MPPKPNTACQVLVIWNKLVTEQNADSTSVIQTETSFRLSDLYICVQKHVHNSYATGSLYRLNECVWHITV